MPAPTQSCLVELVSTVHYTITDLHTQLKDTGRSHEHGYRLVVAAVHDTMSMTNVTYPHQRKVDTEILTIPRQMLAPREAT